MSSGSFRQVEVKCPFYSSDDGKREITCEGIAEKSSIRLIFHTNNGYSQYIGGYCCKDYHMCPLYKVLWAKYEE